MFDSEELFWVDDLTDLGHDYFDPEDEDNYDSCEEFDDQTASSS